MESARSWAAWQEESSRGGSRPGLMWFPAGCLGPQANWEQVSVWVWRLLSRGCDVSWAGLGSQGWAWGRGLGTRFLEKC